MTQLDIQAVRSQFPQLSPSPTGTVFLDNPGGTQVPQSVIDAVAGYYKTANANVGGAFRTSQRTVKTLSTARAAVAALLNAPDPDNIIFGNNMTSLTFHVARSIGDTIRPGDEIVVTDLDHDANVAPWLDLTKQGAVIRVARFDEKDCTLPADAVCSLINENTRLVAVTHASNAVGTIPDVQSVIRCAHSHGALVYVDAVQYVPHRLCDVQALDCDFLACSSYKFFGPHAGILYARPAALSRFSPHKVRPAPNQAPQCWETGTQNHEGIAGTYAAIKYIASIGDQAPNDVDMFTLRKRIEKSMDAVAHYESVLTARLIAGLQEIDGVKIFGITDPSRFSERLCTVAFTWNRYSPAEIASRLGENGICCWSGNYYAMRLMESLGLQETGGAVRVGPVHYNTFEEIERFLDTLRSFAPGCK